MVSNVINKKIFFIKNPLSQDFLNSYRICRGKLGFEVDKAKNETEQKFSLLNR